MKPLTPADAETKSTDLVAGNIDQLKALFPEGFIEGKVDFEVLKQLLGGAVDEREEKYGLNWHGNRRARAARAHPLDRYATTQSENAATAQAFAPTKAPEFLKPLVADFKAPPRR